MNCSGRIEPITSQRICQPGVSLPPLVRLTNYTKNRVLFLAPSLRRPVLSRSLFFSRDGSADMNRSMLGLFLVHFRCNCKAATFATALSQFEPGEAGALIYCCCLLGTTESTLPNTRRSDVPHVCNRPIPETSLFIPCPEQFAFVIRRANCTTCRVTTKPRTNWHSSSIYVL
jgi:hypothetical protein